MPASSSPGLPAVEALLFAATGVSEVWLPSSRAVTVSASSLLGNVAALKIVSQLGLGVSASDL